MTPPSSGPEEDHTRFNLALLGFYVSCTVVGVAVTVAAAALIVFAESEHSTVVAVISIVVTVVASVATWLTLRAARGESPA